MMSNEALRKELKRSVTEADAAEYIGMSASFLRQSRYAGDRETHTPGPKFLKIGRTVRYLIDDLDEWLETHRLSPNGDGAPSSQDRPDVS